MGYLGTTGLQSMDYYLADRHFLPPGEFEPFFTEKIVHLPIVSPFRPSPDAPPVTRKTLSWIRTSPPVYRRSIIIALAMPPASHMLCNPNRTPRCSIALSNVVVSRVPDEPSG